jgi:hypothetical protein
MYTKTNSPAQVISRKSGDLTSLPTIDPYLISNAAAVARIQLRHQQRLEAFTIVCLLQFVWVVIKRVSELRKTPPSRWHVYQSTVLPADLRASYRLQSLIDYHQHFLSKQAVDIITDALYWYGELCLEMKERRGGLTVLAVY